MAALLLHRMHKMCTLLMARRASHHVDGLANTTTSGVFLLSFGGGCVRMVLRLVLLLSGKREMD